MLAWNFEVHKEPLYKRYYAGRMSSTLVFSVLVGFWFLVLPLFIAYCTWGTPRNNSGYWSKERIRYQQPDVSYRYQAIVELNGRSNDGNAPLSLYYSTSPTLNLKNSNTRSAILQSGSFDDDFDGVTDRFEFSIQMPLRDKEEILGLNAVFMHDVKIGHKNRYAFDSASVVQFQSGDSALRAVNMEGDIMVTQDSALQSSKTYRVPYTTPLLPKVFKEGADASQTTLAHIVKDAAARKLTTHFTVTYATPMLSLVPSSIDNSPRFFNATIVMRVPLQPILIQPAIAEVLKLAWIQYMPFLFIFGGCMYILHGYVLSNKLIHSTILADIISEKID